LYIAHGGKVIDVTASKLWKGGLHMKRHHAGKDLTTDIQAAPHKLEVLDRYPQVGVLKQRAASERNIPSSWPGSWPVSPCSDATPTPWSFTFLSCS